MRDIYVTFYLMRVCRRYNIMIIVDILIEIISSIVEKEKYVPNTKKALKYTGIIILATLIIISILLIIAVLLFVR